MGTTNTLDLNNRIDALKKSVTENAEDTHDSEKDIYAVIGQMGAKNLIPYPYTDTTITINGVTFTDNGDGSITVNGTASANADFQIRARATDAIAKLIKNRYTFSGAPTGGGNSTYDMRIGDTVNGSWHPLGFDFGEGVTFELDNDVINVGIGIRIAKNYVCNNLIFKPMLRLASDTDDTYQPYAKTNRELTESYPADKVLMSDGVTNVEDAIDDLKTIGSVLYEYTAGANETWSSALDHLYGHTELNTAILMPNIGLTFMPSVSDRFGTIYINSSGKLITAAIYLKQSGSMYLENAADSTTVSDLGSNTFIQGYKMQVIKMY